MSANRNLRATMYLEDVKHYEVAAALGIAPETFSKKIRYELPKEKAQEYLALIRKIAAQKSDPGKGA